MNAQHRTHTIADVDPMRAAAPTFLNALLLGLMQRSADHAADVMLAA
jgi:hypothetical protein